MNIKVPKQYSRALIDSKTINKELKQFEVVFATETPVYRRGWDENFYEILLCSSDNMRTDRLAGGVVPLLDNHDKFSGVTKQYGAITSFSISNGEARAVVQFSTRSDLQGIWGDIEAGIIKGISAGYVPWIYQREIVADRTEPNYKAVDWEVMEISLAPVPADYNSKIRSDSGFNEPATFDIEIKNVSPKNTLSKMENEKTEVVDTTVNTQERSDKSSAVPVLQPVDTAKIAAEAAKAERQRTIDIRFAVRAAKLDETYADELINAGLSIDVARAQIFEKLAKEDTTPAVKPTVTPTNVSISTDEKDNIRMAMSDAIMHRAVPGSVKIEGKAHDYKYLSLLDCARALLTLNGDKGAHYSPSETIKRAISTTDYPLLLTTTVERTIRRIYDHMPAEWQNIARQTTARDFREKTGIAVDGNVTFEEIAQGGEYRHNFLFTDDAAKIKLKTYGKMIKIGRQAIINDDLSVFDILPKLVAQGAANFQADMVWGLILNNAKTPDGTALFHASHGNLAGAGGAISETTLAAARTALYRMKSPAGALMPTTPKYLIVPIEQLVAAEKLTKSLLASNAMDINTMNGAFTIMTNARLTNPTAWYMAGDPTVYEGLVYAYLEGEQGMFIDKEIDFHDDSVCTKARLDFACAVWDYRGWYKNAGA